MTAVVSFLTRLSRPSSGTPCGRDTPREADPHRWSKTGGSAIKSGARRGWGQALFLAGVLAVGGAVDAQEGPSPTVGISISSIDEVAEGRYRVRGTALDHTGAPACALVLANGKCMFTCGPDSGRCEGGRSGLPRGGFELSDLPLEADGSIRIQVFAEGHVSLAESRRGDPDQQASPADVAGSTVTQEGPSPRAGVSIARIDKVAEGRYRIRGKALDYRGDPACALVLASGRCVFSCGPGSGRCEGGTSSLPKGEFELTDLPLEPDGSVRIQVFVERHVSLAESRFPEPGRLARWGVANNVCCASGQGAFTATIGGVTKQSVLPACAGEVTPSWEGYARITAGPRQVTGTYRSPCGNIDYPLNVSLTPGSCYLLLHDSGREPFVKLLQTTCTAPGF